MVCATTNFHVFFFLMVVMWIWLPGYRAKNFHCTFFYYHNVMASDNCNKNLEQHLQLHLQRLGVSVLQHKQQLALTILDRGVDCFIVLPTGYGKKLVYQLSPFQDDNSGEKKSLFNNICQTFLYDDNIIIVMIMVMMINC